MARAKRTNRTEARRRHRAEQTALADPTAEVAAESAPTRGKGAPSQAPTQRRPGIMASMKAAYRPLDLRGDLRAAPMVLTHWGVLAAIGLTVASAAFFVISYSGAVSSIPTGDKEALAGVVEANQLPYTIFAMLVLSPPPVIGAFLIGFTARRASWLGGLAYGIAVAAAFAVVLATPAGRILTSDQPADAAIAQMAALSPMGAALFASAAAWYRRFLDLANPNRGKARQQQGRATSGKKTASPSARR